MNRQQQALALFDEAVQQPDPLAWLNAQVADDAQLRDAVQALLTADRRATRFLAAPIVLESVARDGQQLGDYHLLRRLGEGGMGAVYLAESRRLNGQKVALKLLRFDAPDLRERFALEQRILGGLEHPAIARLLDAGVAADGAPFLVLEYVDGLPLTDHANQRQLHARERLQLMIRVLDAVQYAHGQLVLHRDLKPSNILVTPGGQPKLLDFGIAKLLGDGVKQPAALTRTGLAPMTVEYASPEQVQGRPLDTRSDSYSLGVVLYELLTGARPYELDRLSPSEMERRICTAVPRRPSMLNPRLPADLDAVLGKALAKEPAQRYRSAAEFAEDLKRVLDSLPVRARPPTLGYRARRFIGRHRLGLTATLLVMLALGTTAAIAVRNAWRADAATAEARRERDTAREVQSWLEHMLANADPRTVGHAPSAAELLDGAAATLGEGLADRPEVERSLRLTLAVAYRGLGLSDQASREAGRALTLIGPATDGLGQSMTLRITAQTQVETGAHASAMSLLARARAALGAQDTPEHRVERTRIDALEGFVHSRAGEVDSAVRAFESAARGFAAAGTKHDSEQAETLNNHAVLMGSGGHFEQALKLHQQADALYARAFGPTHVSTLLSSVNTASVREMLGDVTGAEADYRRLLPPLVERLGVGHPDVIRIETTLAYLLANDGRANEAVKRMTPVVDAARSHLPDPHPIRAYAEAVLGGALLEAGRPADALLPLNRAEAARAQMLPEEHPLRLATQCARLEAEGRSGNAAAVKQIRDLYAQGAAALGNEHPHVARCRQRLQWFRPTE